jgi:lipopolysaccharide/colanic/teichoic acid biosynthesis glycosyltransferase
MAFGISISLGRARNAGGMLLPLEESARAKHSNARPKSRHRASLLEAREPSIMLLTAKRAVDVIGAGLGLLVCAPLFIGIAFAIRMTSPGPIFFRQKRYGYHGRRFCIYKFRTMFVHLGDDRGTHQTQTDDPRVTPIGRILRKSSLDELPQLINVLVGDMSLVGPRPHVPGMLAGGMLYEELTPYYFQRHNMRPGITGLAQVSGYRGSTAVPLSAIERLERDLQYIARWSLLLDLSIIARTIIRELFAGSGD